MGVRLPCCRPQSCTEAGEPSDSGSYFKGNGELRDNLCDYYLLEDLHPSKPAQAPISPAVRVPIRQSERLL